MSHRVNPLRVLLLGAPGSGKGTQAKRIRAQFGITSVSSGDLLRKEVAGDTWLGRQAGEAMAKGALVADDIVEQMMQSHLSEQQRCWLLDGFPRTVAQAGWLDEQLSRLKMPIDAAIHLDVPHETILERLAHRWVHAPSGRVYHLVYNPPKTPGIDDVTGEPLSQRSDDREEVVRARLAAYDAIVQPLLQHYRAQNLLHSFHGHTSDEIWPKIENLLQETCHRKNGTASS